MTQKKSRVGYTRLSVQRNYALNSGRFSNIPINHCGYNILVRVTAVGAGGGTRTHKSFRSEHYQSSAFANFATPAPKRRRTGQSFRSKTHTLTATAVPQGQCSEKNPNAIIVLLRELAFSDGPTRCRLPAKGTRIPRASARVGLGFVAV